MITDASGNTVKEYDYYAFGGIRNQSGSFSNTHKFTGKELDESGLYYFGARYMDNAIGRFITPDPFPIIPDEAMLENPQRLNPYSYCINNPLLYIDPDGRYTLELTYSGCSKHGFVVFRDDNGTILAIRPVSNITTNMSAKPTAVGKHGPSPWGTFKMTDNPAKSVPKKSRKSMGKTKIILGAPGDPNSKILLERGILIHAGRSGVGSKTHGCWRMNEEDINELKSLIEANKSNETKQLIIDKDWDAYIERLTERLQERATESIRE